jgi:UTP--glucose-1-phosphate uridylyltransferase
MMTNDSVIPPDLQTILRDNRFDEALFDDLCRRLRAGTMGDDHNRLKVPVEVPPAEALQTLPPRDSCEYGELVARGEAALAAGQVGVILLNGGMATRFGGVVKGAVPVLEGRTFLELKLRQVDAVSQGRAWMFLMNSFATDEVSQRLVATFDLQGPLRHFRQSVMLRVTPEGTLFLDDHQRPSPCAPGHGDLSSALQGSGALDEFVAQGGRLLLMSNVDNLGATLDPALVGFHLEAGRPMTAEVVAKGPGDAGGAPALVNGQVQIVESFRFPKAFDQGKIPVFNTNTFMFDAAALQQVFPLTWFAVSKKVGSHRAVQFERLAGELSAFMLVNYVHVPREAAEGRFLPVKDPEELEQRRPAIRQVLAERGVL